MMTRNSTPGAKSRSSAPGHRLDQSHDRDPIFLRTEKASPTTRGRPRTPCRCATSCTSTSSTRRIWCRRLWMRCPPLRRGGRCCEAEGRGPTNRHAIAQSGPEEGARLRVRCKERVAPVYHAHLIDSRRPPPKSANCRPTSKKTRTTRGPPPFHKAARRGLHDARAQSSDTWRRDRGPSCSP